MSVFIVINHHALIKDTQGFDLKLKANGIVLVCGLNRTSA
jgi:hypothetical protein